MFFIKDNQSILLQHYVHILVKQNRFTLF